MKKKKIDSLDSSWKLSDQLHSLGQLLKWVKNKKVYYYGPRENTNK